MGGNYSAFYSCDRVRDTRNPLLSVRLAGVFTYGYIEQFEKFGVGRVLRSPEEIAEIPQLIRRYRQPEVSSNLWQPVTSARLQELFSGARKYHHAFAS